VPTSGQPGEVLIITAVVLGAAEVQVVNAESEILQLGGTVEDAKGAADVTALVATAGDLGSYRRWLTWHAGRLIHQLRSAEQRGALPAKAGSAAAHSVLAAFQLLVELADDGADPSGLDQVSAQAVTQARQALLAAMGELQELAPGN
jgi:hypothetical protein